MKITKRQLRRIIKEELASLPTEVITSDAAAEVLIPPSHDEKSGDGEIYGTGGTARMAKSQLFQLAKNAQSLHDMLNDEDKLPEWVQAKIAVMKDNMDAVSDHLGYKIHRHSTNESRYNREQIKKIIREEKLKLRGV